MRPREGERERDRVRRALALAPLGLMGVRERPREVEARVAVFGSSVGRVWVGVWERSREGLRWWAGEDIVPGLVGLRSEVEAIALSGLVDCCGKDEVA